MTDSPGSFTVLLTEGAARDIEGIHRYITDNNSSEHADYVLDQLLKVVESLSYMPERGKVPQELIELGMREYRQVFFKPYRLIYRMMGTQVFIYLVIDGRRDMQSALARRLLGG
ncbi:MAG: type II toxin-antitoxin system RelE/ParE family toxin [Pseudohongiella sp.]|nr:type II toxin-antitoxin system RelE/ParE family toxin [Pseudohongiella sp.]